MAKIEIKLNKPLKNKNIEIVSIAKFGNTILKAIKTTPIYKWFEETKIYKKVQTSHEILKIIGKEQYFKILILSLIKGGIEGFARPKISGVVTQSISQGLQNKNIILWGGLEDTTNNIINILSATSSKEIDNIFNKISIDMYLRATNAFMNQDMDYRNSIGLSAFSTSANHAQKALEKFFKALTNLQEGTASLVSGLGNIMPRHPMIGSMLLFYTTAMAYFGSKYVKNLHEEQYTANDADKTFESTLKEFANNTDLFTQFGTIHNAKKLLKNLAETDEASHKKIARKILKIEIFKSILNTIVNIGTFVGLYFTTQKTGNSINDFITSKSTVNTFFKNSERFAKAIPMLEESLYLFNKAMETINNLPKITEKKDAKELDGSNGLGIKINNMSFSYEKKSKKGIEKTEIFKNFNLEIKPGEKVVIIGESGAGKTTLINLLTRCYDLKNGDGSINMITKENGEKIETNIKDITLTSLRKNICYISANNLSFFKGTIRDNITLLDPSITDEDINFTLGKLNLQEKIKDLNADIYSLGKDFSAGQTERLNLARAFVRQKNAAPINVFDEPTSNISGKIKTDLIDNLKKDFNGKTCIIITHDKDVARQLNADKFITFKDGKTEVKTKKQIDNDSMTTPHKTLFWQYYDDMSQSEKLSLKNQNDR